MYVIKNSELGEIKLISHCIVYEGEIITLILFYSLVALLTLLSKINVVSIHVYLKIYSLLFIIGTYFKTFNAGSSYKCNF
jgi:hypothetical protein